MTLHTAYRPATFAEVLGQDHVVKPLEKMLAKKTQQAFLFEGPSGVGKTTCARLVGKAVGARSSAILEIDAASNTGVDSMRTLTETLSYTPMGGTNRLIILDEAQMLSKQAWNALLKPIEEPKPHTYWVLCTTESAKIPITIRNRCSCFKFREVDPKLIYGLLKQVAKAAGVLQELRKSKRSDILGAIADECLGSPRRALTYLSMCESVTSAREVKHIIDRADAGDEAVISLCRALGGRSSRPSWKALMDLVAKIEGGPESVRMIVTNWFTKVAMGSKTVKDAASALAILDAFNEPYPSHVSGMYPVVLSLGRLMS